MAFSNSQHNNINGSDFSDVGRDQNNVTVTTNITNHYVPVVQVFGNIMISASDGTPHNLLQHNDPETYAYTKISSDSIPSPRSRPIILSDDNDHSSSLSGAVTAAIPTQTPAYCFEITPAIGIVESIIVNIVQSIQSDRSGHYQDLISQLKSLQEISIFARIAVGTCKRVPLGQTLVKCIDWEVGECSVILQELLGKIRRDRSTIIPLWSIVSNDEAKWLTSSGKKLSTHQKSLGQFVMALKELVYLFNILFITFAQRRVL